MRDKYPSFHPAYSTGHPAGFHNSRLRQARFTDELSSLSQGIAAVIAGQVLYLEGTAAEKVTGFAPMHFRFAHPAVRETGLRNLFHFSPTSLTTLVAQAHDVPDASAHRNDRDLLRLNR